MQEYADAILHEYLEDTSETLFGCSYILDAVRVMVKEGKIDHRDVGVVVDGKLINVTKGGLLEEWPAGFCDLTTNQLAKLIA